MNTTSSNAADGLAPAAQPRDVVKRVGLFAALAATVLLVIFALTYWQWMGYMSTAG